MQVDDDSYVRVGPLLDCMSMGLGTVADLALTSGIMADAACAQVDDDSYVRVGPLLDRIAQLPRGPAYLGWVENPGGGPHRDPRSQVLPEI